jgi:lysozyme family protein
MVDSPLNPNAAILNPAQAVAASPYSPAFLKADAQMAKLAGDKVPQSLRYQYWQQIDGDKLATIDPRAAALAYDTAIVVGPQKAIELVAQTKGDPAKMYQMRNVYAQQMAAQDPAKYKPMMERWNQHNTSLGQSLGLTPAANQQGQTPGQAASAPAPTASQTPGQPQAQATPTNRDAMINNIMRTIRGGESGGKYGITSFAEGKGSTASGGYQFADATWQEQARKLGGEATKYKRAKDAPREVQDAVARNYVSDILRRNGDQPAEVFKEWYGGPKKYLTPQELAVNKGLTMDRYLAGRMANYNKIAGGQSGPETIASGQTPSQTADEPTPEKSTFEKAADAVSSGIASANEEKKSQAAPAIPTTKPNVPLPTEPLAPSQRDMYAKALDAISKRNASTPASQPAKPADAQEKAAPAAPSALETTPVKEAATPNDDEA